MAMLEVKNLEVYYGVIQAIKGISFEVNEGEVIALIGANGAGKTTTLQTITGMLSPAAGEIIFEGCDISKIPGHKIVSMGMAHVPEGRRVFAELSVYENLKLGAYTRKDKQEIAESLAKVYESFPRLEERKNQLAGTLSGGEQQMLAMGRALMSKPKIILMDEPFSALDPITRSSLQDQLLQIQENVRKTIVFVTHDMDEAIKIADRICIMHDGNIVQFDTPEEILKHPVNEFVSSFVGKNRIWDSPELIRASDIMIKRVITTYPGVSLVRAYEYMRYNKVDTLMVVDHSQMLQGMITAKMIRRQPRDNHLLVRDIMVNPAYCAQEDDNLVDVMQQTRQHDFYNVPVLDEQGKLRGLITRSSLVTTFSKQFDLEEGEQA